MKYDAKARGLRLDLAVPELRGLIAMASRGARDGVDADATILRGLTAALDAQERKLREIRSAAADRRASRTKADTFDRTLVHNGETETHTYRATRGDFIDTSDLPYHHTWSTLTDENVSAQGELRRNVWCVHVYERTMYADFVGHDCTNSDDRGEIDAVVQAIINRSTR